MMALPISMCGKHLRSAGTEEEITPHKEEKKEKD